MTKFIFAFFIALIKLASPMLEDRNSIVVFYTVTNTEPYSVKVLKWYSPLEGFRSDCFDIKLNEDHQVHYKGIVKKRGYPGPNNYLYLSPGESFTIKLDLAAAYDLTTPGVYTIKAHEVRIDNCYTPHIKLPVRISFYTQDPIVESEPPSDKQTILTVSLDSSNTLYITIDPTTRPSIAEESSE